MIFLKSFHFIINQRTFRYQQKAEDTFWKRWYISLICMLTSGYSVFQLYFMYLVAASDSQKCDPYMLQLEWERK
jgi:hypothetical protein